MNKKCIKCVDRNWIDRQIDMDRDRYEQTVTLLEESLARQIIDRLESRLLRRYIIERDSVDMK